MKIAHFSTYTNGGAAIAARRIHEGLRSIDVESRFYHRHEESAEEEEPDSFGGSQLVDNSELARTEQDICRPIDFRKITSNPLVRPVALNLQRFRHRKARKHYRNHLKSRPIGYELFSPAQMFQPTYFDYWRLNADVVHLHWVAQYIDYASFFGSIPRHIPIVWTLHDMNPFTGGCHYSAGCEGFKTGCGNCPQISHPNGKDVSWESLKIKQKSLRGRPMTVVSPSQWLLDESRKSDVFPAGTKFQVIQYGLDTEAFQPIPKLVARRQLGLDTQKTVLMFGAEDITNRRKGFAYLWQALKQIKNKKNLLCVVFGGGEIPNINSDMPEIKQLGFLESNNQKSLAYSAADLFVMPSLQDNQPQTGLESMACGTPVVAFDAGGIPDYVIHGVTGALAKTASAEDLARQIDWAIASDHRQAMGTQARTMIEQQFGLRRQAVDYLELYRSVISSSATRSQSPKVA